jgi:hypothetical protein
MGNQEGKSMPETEKPDIELSFGSKFEILAGGKPTGEYAVFMCQNQKTGVVEAVPLPPSTEDEAKPVVITGGGYLPERIGKVVGKMELEEIINLYQTSQDSFIPGRPLDKRIVENLRKYSQMEPITIKVPKR